MVGMVHKVYAITSKNTVFGKITIIISHTTAKVKRFGAERVVDNLHIIRYNIFR